MLRPFIWPPVELWNCCILSRQYFLRELYETKSPSAVTSKTSKCVLSSCVLTPVPSLLCYYQSPAPASQVKHNRSINKEVLISMTASHTDLMCSCRLSKKKQKNIALTSSRASVSSLLVQRVTGWYRALPGFTLLMLYDCHQIGNVLLKTALILHKNIKTNRK